MFFCLLHICVCFLIDSLRTKQQKVVESFHPLFFPSASPPLPIAYSSSSIFSIFLPQQLIFFLHEYNVKVIFSAVPAINCIFPPPAHFVFCLLRRSTKSCTSVLYILYCIVPTLHNACSADIVQLHEKHYILQLRGTHSLTVKSAVAELQFCNF